MTSTATPARTSPTSPPDGLASGLFVGRVRHRRFLPREHVFENTIDYLYLDLDELDRVFEGRWLWSVGRSNVASFRREDYLGPHDVDLATAARDRVETALGRRPTGPVRLLTHLRMLGMAFDPVSFYYCFDEQGELDAVVGEITNTPWRERHCYVVGRNDRRAIDAQSNVLQARFDKSFHVSPFMGMEQQLDWRFTTPRDGLVVHMESYEKGTRLFDATLTLSRRPLDGRSLAASLLRRPIAPLAMLWGIHWHALRLWLKRVPVYDHPAKQLESQA